MLSHEAGRMRRTSELVTGSTALKLVNALIKLTIYACKVFSFFYFHGLVGACRKFFKLFCAFTSL